MSGPLSETESSPWALQLAARIEKAAQPTTAAVCAAAALATIALLDDERSGPGGRWHDAVAAWNGARIRKIVRRGRTSAWQRAQELEGVTIERDGAEVRAFVPAPMHEAPAEIAKLQIQSTPLDDVVAAKVLPDIAAAALVIAVTPRFAMSWGKQAAQCAHAAQRAWMTADRSTIDRWDAAGRPIVIVHPDNALWEALGATATTKIHDGGLTEIPPGTMSAIAWWQP